jgi:hypothetical protein
VRNHLLRQPIPPDGGRRSDLKDPSNCVRIETARVLEHLDPKENQPVFELALYDNNPDVVYFAEKLTKGKGYSMLKW